MYHLSLVTWLVTTWEFLLLMKLKRKFKKVNSAFWYSRLLQIFVLPYRWKSQRANTRRPVQEQSKCNQKQRNWSLLPKMMVMFTFTLHLWIIRSGFFFFFPANTIFIKEITFTWTAEISEGPFWCLKIIHDWISPAGIINNGVFQS